MGSRAKWFLGALTCLIAVLTATTFAQAVDQTPKNGCTSPQPYSGSLTTPSFNTNPDGPTSVSLQGWFEIESVAPGSFDVIPVEYSLDPGPGQLPRDWIEFGSLTDPAQVQPNTSSAADVPYSNGGTSVAPQFQIYNFTLPDTTIGAANVQIRFRFDTVDATYQGFRGVGIDDVTSAGATPAIAETFENGIPGTWQVDGPSGPGGPFWQVPPNPGGVSVKNPEINPNLVTLPDSGALPTRPGGGLYAWFGNTDSGTFCGPDFAAFDQAPDTIITDGPPDSTASEVATFSFTATEPAAFFQCTLDGNITGCSSPQQYTGLENGTHTFTVQAADLTGNVDATPATRTWTIRPATLDDLPAPQVGVSVNVQEVAGTVLVGIPNAAAARSGGARGSQKGINFVPLSEAEQIPVGSFLDTRKGTVALQSAQNSAGKRQSGKFLEGLFQVRQSRKRRARGLTDLILKGSSFARCGRRGKGASAALSRRRIRRLRANAQGRFRTSGSNSSATVRGTIWDITDRCDGTLTHVKRGKVVVRDFRRKKNITLTSGKSYLAKARG